MYKTSIRTVSGYVARKYNNGDNIKIILSDFKMTTLEKPKDLYSTADDVDKDVYREDIKSYAKEKHALTKNAKNLYSLVLGQCTEILRAKLKGKEEWKEIDKNATQ